MAAQDRKGDGFFRAVPLEAGSAEVSCLGSPARIVVLRFVSPLTVTATALERREAAAVAAASEQIGPEGGPDR